MDHWLGSVCMLNHGVGHFWGSVCMLNPLKLFNLDCPKVYSPAIFETYFSNEKYTWIAVSGCHLRSLIGEGYCNQFCSVFLSVHLLALMTKN